MDPYTQEQQQPAPHRSNGCLWACLGTLIAGVVIVVGVFGFGAWYFYKGFEHDSRVQYIMQTVRDDPRAQAVLGKNIKLLQLEVHTYDYSTGKGGTASYVLRLAGSEGEGELKVDLDIKGDGPKITMMVLTKDGRETYLVGVPPPHPMMDRSI
jgi:hypothetical protein